MCQRIFPSFPTVFDLWCKRRTAYAAFPGPEGVEQVKSFPPKCVGLDEMAVQFTAVKASAKASRHSQSYCLFAPLVVTLLESQFQRQGFSTSFSVVSLEKWKFPTMWKPLPKREEILPISVFSL